MESRKKWKSSRYLFGDTPYMVSSHETFVT